MSEIKLSPELEKAIGRIDGDKKLVDSQGNVKGYIITPMMHDILNSFLKPPTREEIDAVTPDTPGYSTAEAIAYLRSRFPGSDL